jgi:hypothetical protein
MRNRVFAFLLMTPDFARAEMPLYFQEEERVLANKFIDGVMHVNGRDFLMGDLHEWPKGTHDYSVHFMVRSSIWLRDFLDQDPVLMHQALTCVAHKTQVIQGQSILHIKWN